MRNIEELLKEAGVEIPADKVEAFKKEFNANYKTVVEYDKKNDKIKSLEESLTSANDALKNFENVKPEELTNEIAKLKQDLEDRDKKYQSDLLTRDKNDAISRELDKVKFTSSYSRKAVEDMIKQSAISYENGKLYGFDDRLEDIRKTNADAFVDEAQQKLEEGKVKFTNSLSGGGAPVTMDDFRKLKTSEERQKFIREHQEMFTRK